MSRTGVFMSMDASTVPAGGVYGFGADSYRLALLALARLLEADRR